jgi:hypothetical protein
MVKTDQDFIFLVREAHIQDFLYINYYRLKKSNSASKSKGDNLQFYQKYQFVKKK